MTDRIGIQFVEMHPNCAPQRMDICDAGYDLRAAKAVRLNVGESVVVPLGVAFGLPKGYFGMLTHRSSLAFKKNLVCSLGIIDSNYTGEVKAKIFNMSQYYQFIEEGDRICQIIFRQQVDSFLYQASDLEPGKAGFGSSGGLSNGNPEDKRWGV